MKFTICTSFSTAGSSCLPEYRRCWARTLLHSGDTYRHNLISGPTLWSSSAHDVSSLHSWKSRQFACALPEPPSTQPSMLWIEKKVIWLMLLLFFNLTISAHDHTYLLWKDKCAEKNHHLDPYSFGYSAQKLPVRYKAWRVSGTQNHSSYLNCISNDGEDSIRTVSMRDSGWQQLSAPATFKSPKNRLELQHICQLVWEICKNNGSTVIQT